MKLDLLNRWKKLTVLNQILYLIIAALVLVIVSATVIKVFVDLTGSSGTKNNSYKIEDPAPTEKTINSLNKKSETNVAAYTGIGTIRAITAPTADNTDSIGTPMVITPWFTYPEGDTVFFEELSRKRILIKGIITNYFLEYTQEQLLSFTEEKIKADLLQLINSQLSLGKISHIYFTDYIFL